MASPQAKADAAKAALASTATCTTATVVTLKELLLPDAETSSPTPHPASRTGNRTTTNTRTKKAGTARANAAKSSDDQLSTKDRAALATHVINIAIKSLNDAAKAAPPSTPSKRQPSHGDLRKAAAPRTLRRSLSAPLSPLQPRTLNRVATSPSISSKTTSQPIYQSTGCLATVECARVAFACLRSIMGPVQPSQTDFQLENGMSAFISKLIALGIQDQALKELRILKRRLDLTGDKTTKPGSEGQTAAQTIAELLDYGQTVQDQLLSVVTACQTQVLRWISHSKKPAHIEAALPFLEETHPSSPITLFQRLAGQNEKEAQKTARQLASLSQTLLSLAPSVTSKEDQVATEPRLSPSPRSAFKLQVLCFKTQLRWWKMADHRGSVDDDILSPFARCLRAFTRRHTPTDGSIYDTAATSFNELMELIRTQKSQAKDLSDSPLASVYQLLGVAAQTDRHYDAACHWFQTLKELLDAQHDSTVRVFSVSARLVAASLKQAKCDSKTGQLIQEVVESLDGGLSGNINELNELLESLSLARRSAVGLLVNHKSEPNTGNKGLDSILANLKTFIMRFPRFSRRWLGTLPGKDATAKTLLQFDQRRQVLMQTISQILDGAMMVLNGEIQTDSIDWKLLDEVLWDCSKLVESVLDPTISAARTEQLSTYFIKISSLYFARYTQLRKDMGKSKQVNKEVLQSLSRSIEMIRDRPMAQQEKAQISMKLELFADLCKAANRSKDAIGTLRSICTNMIEEGALVKVTSALTSQPPGVAWSADEKAETLSRTLLSIAKLDQSWNDWAFFLPEGERAAVLEHLMQISGGMASQGPLKLHDPSVQALLRIYTVDRFPIRRLRVLLQLFFQNIGEEDETEQIGNLTHEALRQLDNKTHGEDSSLVRFIPHLQTYHQSVSALAVAEAPFPVSTMRDAISSWKSMTEACTSRADLYERIDNLDGLVAHLESASQFASLRGENSLQLAILELSTPISKILAEPTYNNVILNHTLLASQHLNIGHFSEAKKTLEATKDLLDQAEGASRGIVAGFHLAQAEYYSGIGSIDEANSSLATAKAIYDESTSTWAASKSRINMSLALSSFTDSVLALKQGRVQEALACIKSSVRILSHDWSKIETSSSRAASPVDLNASTASIGSVKAGSRLGQVIGPRFWSLAFPLLRGLLHLSSVYAHLGMYQETVYYAESAQKIAESTGSPMYRAQVLAWTGSVYHRAGKLSKALDFGNEALDEMPQDICSSRVQVACQLGSLYRDAGDEEKARELLQLAEETAQRLGDHGTVLSIQAETKKTTAATAKGRAATSARTTRATRTTRARATTTPAPRTRKREPAKSQALGLAEMKLPKDVYQASLMASVILSRALGFINQKDWSSALSTLEQAKELPKLFGALSQEQVVTAMSLIGHSTEQMIHDPVFSVIQDSTISFPAIAACDKGSGRLSLNQTPPRKGRTATGATERKGSKERGVPAFANALRQAQELLLEAHASTLSTANSTMVHRISALLQNTVILLSATSTTQSKVIAGSGFATFSVDLARNITWKREQSTLQAKEATQTRTRSGDAASSPTTRRSSLGLTTEMAKFQKSYIELVPHNWSVISVSLSDNHHDLCITKFQAGHSPFILRLPLERANSRDADSEVFNFEHGRDEMMEIIQLANETSHSANRDFSAKGAKSAWWAEREALDERLKDLLDTIETTWLGGFKGIFSQHERRPDLLARFQKSFQQILDSSLPSRRQVRGKKTAKTPKVSLDPRVLDLFIGLGDPTDPDCDFDEALNDLLYFVVDILQFHGERNAYDEIDFDAMVVETYDALRGYYNAAKSGSERADGAHTVLVLDKALHAFPWESMPCMEGLAVSRVPSLASLRQLILESQPSAGGAGGDDPPEDILEGHYVSAERGTYILNPSTDLVNTQASFQPSLETLPSWTGIVNRAPQEGEFEEALTKSEILLYFGHGSGAQYVRARTIRRLGKCKPATFLMGCSSASLTEAGEFENYGPVWNYMMAGCPAVVGTLWDVTDRDIDRFAGRSFEEWGLFPRGTFRESKRGKGKRKASDEDARDGEEDGQVARNVSLAEAVARSREACKFKYLNAAAVVLYGIPVYIKHRGDE